MTNKLESAGSAAWVLAFVLCCGAGVLGEGYDPEHDLLKLQEAIYRVAAEYSSLQTRADNLHNEKMDFLATVQNLRDRTVSLQQNQMEQMQILQQTFLSDIKNALHGIGNLEADTAQVMSVATSNRDLLIPSWNDIDSLSVLFDKPQTARIARAKVALEKSNAKTVEFLGELQSNFVTETNSLFNNMFLCSLFVSGRRCYQSYVEVEIDYTLAEGAANITLPEIDNDALGLEAEVPTVVCGIQSIVSSQVELDSEHGGYDSYHGKYEDERQNYGVTVDCKPFADRVDVRAFDQSRGRGNRVASVVVEMRACYISALAPAPEEIF